MHCKKWPFQGSIDGVRMPKMKVSEYRSIGTQSIGDTGTKNHAGTTDTSIPIGTSMCTLRPALKGNQGLQLKHKIFQNFFCINGLGHGMTNFPYFIVHHQIWKFIIINLQKYFLTENEKSYLLLDLSINSISIKFCMVMSRELVNVDVYGILCLLRTVH